MTRHCLNVGPPDLDPLSKVMPIDPGTGIAIFGATVGNAQTIQRILGPTADYIGEGIKTWTELRVNNVRRIIDSAERKLGENSRLTRSVPGLKRRHAELGECTKKLRSMSQSTEGSSL